MAARQTVLWCQVLDRLAGPNPPELIVIDPRWPETVRKATLRLVSRAGTKLALLNGIQHLLFKNGWIDYGYVFKHTVELQKLRATVAEYNPQKVEDITGAGAETCGGTMAEYNKIPKEVKKGRSSQWTVH